MCWRRQERSWVTDKVRRRDSWLVTDVSVGSSESRWHREPAHLDADPLDMRNPCRRFTHKEDLEPAAKEAR